MNLKPVNQPVPEAFADQVPLTAWRWWDARKPRDLPWYYTYYNPYLWSWGAVFKFGPSGGVVYGYGNGRGAKPGAPAPEFSAVTGAPEGSTEYSQATLGRTLKVKGALWRYHGYGPCPAARDKLGCDPGCLCITTQLDADPYGRVFAPNIFRFSVEMLDTSGNQIARIGRYGNADSAGPGSGSTGSPPDVLSPSKGRPPEPEIALAWPVDVSVADGKVYILDAASNRVTIVKFEYSAAAECPVP